MALCVLSIYLAYQFHQPPVNPTPVNTASGGVILQFLIRTYCFVQYSKTFDEWIQRAYPEFQSKYKTKANVTGESKGLLLMYLPDISCFRLQEISGKFQQRWFKTAASTKTSCRDYSALVEADLSSLYHFIKWFAGRLWWNLQYRHLWTQHWWAAFLFLNVESTGRFTTWCRTFSWNAQMWPQYTYSVTDVFYEMVVILWKTCTTSALHATETEHVQLLYFDHLNVYTSVTSAVCLFLLRVTSAAEKSAAAALRDSVYSTCTIFFFCSEQVNV